MDDLEPYDGTLLEVGDEFGPSSWFLYPNNSPPPYFVTGGDTSLIHYSHIEFPNGDTLSRVRSHTPFQYFMRRKSKFMEYDPSQQGEDDDSI